MNYAVEETKNIERYFFLSLALYLNSKFIFSPTSLNPLPQDFVCLSAGWCAHCVLMLSPGQHCILHSAFL